MKHFQKFLFIILLLALISPDLSWGQKSLQSLSSEMMNRIRERQKTGRIVNFFEGVVSRVTDSESLWIHIDNKKEFIRWTYKLSENNLNVDRQEVRVWLQFVSPKRSISKGKKYNDWFKKNVAYELGKNFRNRRVRIDYTILKNVYRLEGLVWSGDANINLWLVENGWSFYLLSKGESHLHQDFLAAEQKAKERQVGLWQPTKKN